MIAELLPDLAEAIAAEFKGKAPGHCLRVDDLVRDDAAALCSRIGQQRERFDCLVLAPKPAETWEADADRAVHLRNRKEQSLCLIVPLESRDFLPESLENAFARFDIPGFLSRKRDKLISTLPPNLQEVARSLKSLLRGRAAVATEAFIEYLAQVSRDLRAETAGRAVAGRSCARHKRELRLTVAPQPTRGRSYRQALAAAESPARPPASGWIDAHGVHEPPSPLPGR